MLHDTVSFSHNNQFYYALSIDTNLSIRESIKLIFFNFFINSYINKNKKINKISITIIREIDRENMER